MRAQLRLRQPAAVHFHYKLESFCLLSIDMVIILYTIRDYQRVILNFLAERVHGYSIGRRCPSPKSGPMDDSMDHRAGERDGDKAYPTTSMSVRMKDLEPPQSEIRQVIWRANQRAQLEPTGPGNRSFRINKGSESFQSNRGLISLCGVYF